MKTHPAGAEFHADRHDESNNRFSQFCESALKRNRGLIQGKLASHENDCFMQSDHNGCRAGGRFSPLALELDI